MGEDKYMKLRRDKFYMKKKLLICFLVSEHIM